MRAPTLSFAPTARFGMTSANTYLSEGSMGEQPEDHHNQETVECATVGGPRRRYRHPPYASPAPPSDGSLCAASPWGLFGFDNKTKSYQVVWVPDAHTIKMNARAP